MAQRNDNALQVVSSAALAEGTTFTERQVELIRNQIAPDATPDELMLFLQVSSSRGLDPFRKHIYAVSRWDGAKKRMVTAHQVSIDGLRLIAERTGKYEGQIGPFWCGKDGIWQDIWLKDEAPAAAKVGVFKTGFREPLFSVAKFATYVQKTKEGRPTKFWADMPEVMIAKVAEAASLRRAFPEETGGLYVREEMDQAENSVHGEVIDHATGEIVQAQAEDHWERASRRLHAAAAKHGIDHDVLHRWAIGTGHASFRDVKPNVLAGLALKLEQEPADTIQKLSKYMARPTSTPEPEPTEATFRSINTAPPSDDEMSAAMNASTPASLPLDYEPSDPERFTR